MSEPEEAKSGSVPLTRAAKVLAAVADRRAGAQLTEIARSTDLPLSTIHRLVGNLVAVGFLEAGDRGAYRIGPAIRRLSHLAMDSTDLEAIVRPVLEDLSKAVRQTSFVTRLRNQILEPAVTVMPGGVRHVLVNPGADFPLNATASGKIVFAHQPQAVVAEQLKRKRQKYRPRTLTRREEILAELDRAKAAGFAESDDEYDEGVYALAAPIRTAGLDVMYAVGIVGLKGVMFQHIERRDMISLVKQAARKIEARLCVD